jgi:hypothetical protein
MVNGNEAIFAEQSFRFSSFENQFYERFDGRDPDGVGVGSWRRIESYRLEYGQNSIPAQLPVSLPILNNVRFDPAPHHDPSPSIRIPSIENLIKLIVDT